MLPILAALMEMLLLLASLAGCAFLGFACFNVLKFTQQRPIQPPGFLPPVSVLKPLHGEDKGLEQNLRSFCQQQFPQYQIIFGVQGEDDPAKAVAEKIKAEFPARDIALVVDARQQTANLKVANLLNMLPLAKHPVLVIADSDMRVTKDYLSAVTAPLNEPDVGLVTCLYKGTPAGGNISSQLACLHVNHNFMPQALVGRALKKGDGCFGASIAMRRDMLEAIGGLAAIGGELADDHALGARVVKAGKRIVLSDYVIENCMDEPDFAALFQHELRWARTIRLLAPVGYAGLIVTHPVALATGALGLACLAQATLWPALGGLGFALTIRLLTVFLQDRALKFHEVPLWLVPLRDYLSFAVFFTSFFSNRVAWRDHVFDIGSHGQIKKD